jgi:hypothetical protein
MRRPVTARAGHPAWCVHPAGEDADGLHASAPIGCNPAGPGVLLGVGVRLLQPHPPLAVPPWISLDITEDADTRPWPLPLPQARVLVYALRRLLQLAEREARS